MDIHKEQEQYLTNASAIIKAVANTGIRIFVYYPQKKSIFVPEGTCLAYQCQPEYMNMPHSFAEDYVHPKDYAVFKEMYYKIDRGDHTASATFHSKELKYCNHVTLTTVSWTEDELPQEAIGIIEDVSDLDKNLQVINELQKIISMKETEEEADEALKVMASSIGSQYYAVYYIDINSHSYTCFQEQLPGILSVIGEKGPYEPAWQKYIDYYIAPEDQSGMREFSNLSTLADRIGKQTSITRNYRRKNIGWTRGQYIAGKRDENGRLLTIIYTVTDIEKEVTQAKEKESAQYEAQHDPLTGLWNRKGLEVIVANKKKLGSKIGLAVMDIDNFKQINDRYGHDAGDKILATLAEKLRQTFRLEDYIIRTGGDEFMILLENCEDSVWGSFCRKIKALHVSMEEEFSGYIKEVGITLSVGLCFSETGYHEDLVKLADEALYRTKRNGRAGCTLIDSEHKIVRQWTDESLSLCAQNVLAYTNMGVCQIEIPLDETKNRRLICGEAIKIHLGVEKNATSEECYTAWQKRIDPSYQSVLEEAERTMLTEGQTECTYLWNHPEWGSIYVRSGGVGRVEEKKIILQGYHQFLKDIKIVEKEDEAKKFLYALNKMYSCSYYMNLETNTYSTFKFSSGTYNMHVENRSLFEILDEFINEIVSPVDHDKMSAFMDFDTLQQRLDGEKSIDCEYRSQTVHGWCRAKFLPIHYNSEGKLTHVIFLINSLDEAKGKELDITEYNKRSLNALFDHVPGGIVLYEWNGKTLQVLHMSKYYKELYGYSMLNNSDSPDFLRLHPDDVEDYQKAILKALSETHELEYVFRVWNEKQKKYGWTQVNAVSEPQPEGTSLVYAMYSDITVQKEMELLSEERQRLVVNAYENQMEMLLAQNADALCRCNVNLTKNEFYRVEAEGRIKEYSKKAQTLDEFMKLTAQSVGGAVAQQEYRDLFNQKKLLSLFEDGKKHIEYECFYHISPTHTEWVETVFDFVVEPDTRDIVGMCYAKSRNEEKMSRILLDASLDNNIPLAALIYVDSEEYYRYEKVKGEHCEHHQNYWKEVLEKMKDIVDEESLQFISNKFSKKEVLSELEKNGVYAYSFDGQYEGRTIRLEVKYQYADQEQNLLLAVLHDITDQDLYQKYKYESEHDLLTGLLNRNAILTKAREIMSMHPKEQFVMLHGDIRRFHLYNTFFGDKAGDGLLCKVADILRRMDKDYEYWVYGRMEADVFCAFFPVQKGHFERHIRFLYNEISSLSKAFPLEPAIGAYWVTDPSMSMEEMFSRATIAAKSGKRNLFNMISRYDISMEQELKDTQDITSEMHRAIEEGQFEVYLQPKYSLQEKKVVGAEALARWKHPKRGLVSPGKFIPIFEKNGFITELDRYMWEHVCQLLQTWKKQGKTIFPISVNISRVNMYSQTTVPYLKALVEKYQIDPYYLELELTETAYMDAPVELKVILKDLQQCGFKILMDDFGSGYSSLNTLKDLPVDILKLDMRLLEGAQNDARAGAVLTSVIQMSKMLELPIVAEGVEEQEQADYLQSLGCEYVQGYLFARPMQVKDYEKLVFSEID